MSNLRACPDTLVARARKGALLPTERAQLDAHREQCVECQLSLMIGTDFDQDMVIRRGDELMAARIVSAVENVSSRSVPRRVIGGAGRRRATMVWMIAAVFLVVGVGIAATVSWQRTHRLERRVMTAPTHNVASHALSNVHSAPVIVATETASDAIPVTPPSQTPLLAPSNAPSTAPRGSTNSGHSASDPVLTSGGLFALANARRRAGDDVRARSLYAELQRTYPNSTEAIVSNVSLGRMLLERYNDPRRALAQFDHYLAQHTQTELMAEATYGRADALMRLGRRDDERAAWTQLLARFPNSLYASRARARLQELR